MEKKLFVLFFYWMSDWHSFWLELQRERSTDDWWCLQMFSAVKAKKTFYLTLLICTRTSTFMKKIIFFFLIWQRCQLSRTQHIIFRVFNNNSSSNVLFSHSLRIHALFSHLTNSWCEFFFIFSSILSQISMCFLFFFLSNILYQGQCRVLTL